MCILFLLALFAAFFFIRKGVSGGGRPPWIPKPAAPEDEAKRVLSERFARGDISTDEFLERASVLNWTPGTEAPWNDDDGKKKRH